MAVASRNVDDGSSWAARPALGIKGRALAPAPAPAPSSAVVSFPSRPPSSSSAWYDALGLQALLARTPAASDGRRVLNHGELDSLLLPQRLTLASAASDYWTTQGGENEYQAHIVEAATYTDASGRRYGVVENESSQSLIDRGLAPIGSTILRWLNREHNPTGSDHDDVAPFYTLGAGGLATPVSSGENYTQGWWVDGGRLATEILAVLATVGVAGAAAAAAGAAEAGAGAAAAGVDGALGAGAGYVVPGAGTYAGLTTAQLGTLSAGLDAGLSVAAAEAAAGYGSSALSAASSSAVDAAPGVYTETSFSGVDLAADAGLSGGNSIGTAASAFTPAAAAPLGAGASSVATVPPASAAVPAAGGFALPTLSQVGQAAGLLSTLSGLVRSVTGQPTAPQHGATGAGGDQAAAQAAAQSRLLLIAIAGAALILTIRK